MTLNSTGKISLGGTTAGESVNLELGNGPGTSISMNNTVVRTLAGKASGAVTMPGDFYGKSYITTTWGSPAAGSSIGSFLNGVTISAVTLTASTTVGSVIYSISSGSLPTGLSLSGSGVISGTPTQNVSSQSFTVSAVSSAGGTPVTRTFYVTTQILRRVIGHNRMDRSPTKVIMFIFKLQMPPKVVYSLAYMLPTGQQMYPVFCQDILDRTQ
jgi:hypothetical protein